MLCGSNDNVIRGQFALVGSVDDVPVGKWFATATRNGHHEVITSNYGGCQIGVAWCQSNGYAVGPIQRRR